MKIIHLVLGKANPQRMNGVNKVAYQLAVTQTNLGYDTSVWGIANTPEKNFPKRNFKTFIFQQYKNKIRLDVNLFTAINQLPPNTVFHIHGAFIPEFFRISRLLKKKGIPYIYTPHGSLTKMAMLKNSAFKKIYFQLFESRLIAGAKKVQLLGIHEYDYLDTLTTRADKCLIANGQDLSEISEFNFDKKKNAFPVFGFCGRLALFHKGLDLMLEGFAIYRKHGGKGSLELIGDGDDRGKLEKIVSDLGIRHYVIFHGKKFGADKFRLLARQNVFLHTSRMEGFPTAVLEAAAMKIPTITSEATNINPFVQQYNSGFVLEKNTPEEIAAVLEKATNFFHAGKLDEMGRQARKMVEKEFNWNGIAHQLINIYKS